MGRGRGGALGRGRSAPPVGPRPPPTSACSPVAPAPPPPAPSARLPRRPGGLATPGPPLRVPPASLRLSPGCGGGGSDCAHSAPAFQPAYLASSLPGGLLTPLTLFPAGFHHCYTPLTILPRWLLFITSGSGRLEHLAAGPRLGRRDLGLAARSLAPRAVWVRRPKSEEADKASQPGL